MSFIPFNDGNPSSSSERLSFAKAEGRRVSLIPFNDGNPSSSQERLSFGKAEGRRTPS